MDIPIALRTAMESGGVALFLGAGICHNYLSKNGVPAPDGEELARRLAKAIDLDVGEHPDLAKVSQLVEQRTDRANLERLIIAELTDLEPDETLVWLLSKTWRTIYTTNYDRVIQRAYELVDNPTQEPLTFTASRDLAWIDSRFQVGVFHLHGSLFEGEHRSALITSLDYARFREQRAMLFDFFKQSFATSPILYVGYSNRDPNWDMVRAELAAEFSPAVPPESFRVAPTTDAIDEEVLQGQGITTLHGTLDDLRDALERDLPGLRVEPARLTDLKASVPPALGEIFDESPAAVARLMKSWTFVNQEDFGSPANTHAYLRGDAPSWSAIAQDVPFERDIEDRLYEALLDAATDPGNSLRSHLLLGPAGYGVSTVLQRLAVRLVNDQVGSVLWHRSSAPFLQADVTFAASALAKPVVFVVDNASDADDELPAAIGQLRQGRNSCVLLLGDRLNEWRQRGLRTRPREWGLEALSEVEIVRLLECLRSHKALGILEDLPPKLQAAAVREKHGKELLVAMREATAGRGFDAIVEDEYWSLDSDLARSIYGLVSSLYRMRAVARVGLISGVLGVNPTEVFACVATELEGVVILDTIDEELGITVARPRHHVIAEMLWARCLSSSQREAVLLDVIKHLNLNFPADALAFDRLVRADDAVDAISDLEGRTQFFETACKKDPSSPYVRQHYARMLRRADRQDLALEQVEEGLSLGGGRVLHHTRGVILSDMAVAAVSPEVGRRRLVQAEEAFKRVLSMNPRDEYGYQGLCDLYFHWATIAPSPEEQAEYLRKCEEAISEGLLKVKDKEGLWIVSASVAQYLDDSPGVIESLKKAVQDGADAIVSRFLLAREYFDEGQFQSVIDTLTPVLEAHPDEYRSAILCATALYSMGRPAAESVAILNLSSLAAARDSRYLAMLGGFHFLAGNVGEADKTAKIAERADLSVDEQRRVAFYAEEHGVRLVFQGKMLRLRSGFAFVRTPDFQRDIFCPGPELGVAGLVEGSAVAFNLGFTARGPIVCNLQLT